MIISDDQIHQNSSASCHRKKLLSTAQSTNLRGNNRENYLIHLIQREDRLALISFLKDILIVTPEFILGTNPLIGHYSMAMFSRPSNPDRPLFNWMIGIETLIHMSGCVSWEFAAQILGVGNCLGGLNLAVSARNQWIPKVRPEITD
jgi:hypothetical protein